jgi:hypothetical protein
MTREKEIELAMKDSVAETIYASGWGITPQVTDLLECAFTKGAEWADRNPKFSKQEFIAKVKRWLELETDWNMEYNEEGRNLNYGKIDELVKYLEE